MSDFLLKSAHIAFSHKIASKRISLPYHSIDISNIVKVILLLINTHILITIIIIATFILLLLLFFYG